jgi:carboxyl-terminal processing protease
VGESTRESALPWDRIRPVEFGRETQLTQAVATLEQAHQRRIAQDADFVSLLGDLDSFEKVRTQKKISLNLQKRVAEREALEAERLARENTRRAAHGEAPVAKLADVNASEAPDPTLAEAAEIAADMSGMGSLYLSKLKSDSDNAPATP